MIKELVKIINEHVDLGKLGEDDRKLLDRAKVVADAEEKIEKLERGEDK